MLTPSPLSGLAVVDCGDGELDHAHDREDGDGYRRLSARRRAQQHLCDSATIVHRRRERGKFDGVYLTFKRSGVGDIGLTPDDGPRVDQR
jgi:hypothetical protein